LPLVANPDRNTTEPELPERVVPLLSSNEPDVPDEPAFEVATVMEPVVALLLPPAMIDTEPPNLPDSEAYPEDKYSEPPLPESVLPAKMLTLPPRPDVACPEAIRILPVLPDRVEPDWMETKPLEPETPPWEVATNTLPLDVSALKPLAMLTEPPYPATVEDPPPSTNAAPPV